ncbi:hypothetical protein [Streptosporangium sp. NPDC001681]|uniref:hypothetical protein n=1 Tax=Streptosporangium sp. NPDC001681 TaxID=3154395 RepID=UPI00332595B9
MAADKSVLWVVVDEDFGLHVEASAYLAGLRGADRSNIAHARRDLLDHNDAFAVYNI